MNPIVNGITSVIGAIVVLIFLYSIFLMIVWYNEADGYMKNWYKWEIYKALTYSFIIGAIVLIIRYWAGA